MSAAGWWWSRERDQRGVFTGACGLWAVHCWHCGRGTLPHTWAGVQSTSAAVRAAMARAA